MGASSGDVDNRMARDPRKHTIRVVVSLVVAAIMVAAGLASAVTLGWGPFARPNPTTPGPSGPGLRVQVDPPAIVALANEPFGVVAGSLEVQISSIFPSSVGYSGQNLVGLNITTNSYSDSLFLGSPGASGVVSGNLSSQFYAIDKAWLPLIGALTQTVSLQMYATLSVVANGTDSVYTFYNNLPYNPRAPPSVFTSIVAFPSTPTFSVPATMAPAVSQFAPDGIGPPPCDAGYYWEGWNSTYISNGYLPLAIGNAAGSPSGAELSYGISFSQSALQLSFTSDTAYTSYSSLSGLQMSQSPSWSG